MTVVGCSAQQGSMVATTPAAAIPPESDATAGNWTTFAHDYARTGRSNDELPIDKSNVSRLAPRWVSPIVDATIASPLVYDNRVFVTTLAGKVLALDTSTGAVVWQTQVATTSDKLISMTPTIADGMLFVGSHTLPSQFAALDVATGAIRWQTTLAGYVRGVPVVANGMVYLGEAGGDSPGCIQGGVHALDERTGNVIWTWHVDRYPMDGGSSWGPLSYDGSSLFVGTGNTCLAALETANALVRLDLNGKPQWSFAPVNSTEDSDFGGAPLLVGANLFAQGKNGVFYDISASDGHVVWQRPTGGIDQFGGFGSPTTDGTTLVVPTGSKTDPNKNVDAGSQLLGLDFLGNTKWAIPTKNEIPGYAAIGNGIAYVGLDEQLAAIDVATGTKLWTFTAPQVFYASPVIVPSGLYAVDEDGNVYAFDVAPSSAAAAKRMSSAHDRARRSSRPRYRWNGRNGA